MRQSGSTHKLDATSPIKHEIEERDDPLDPDFDHGIPDEKGSSDSDSDEIFQNPAALERPKKIFGAKKEEEEEEEEV